MQQWTTASNKKNHRKKTKQLHKKHETLNMNTLKANFLPNH